MNKILVVVDFQNDFVDGALGFQKACELDEKIASKVLLYGKGNVFYTLDTHFENYLSTREGRKLPVKHCIKGSEGFKVYGKTKTALESVHAVALEKYGFGLDITTEINKKLPQNIDSVELVGLVSNICVLSNAVIFQTRYREAVITVDASMTASFDDTLNEKALDVMEGLQVNVINRETGR